jgi:hypothetical protein
MNYDIEFGVMYHDIFSCLLGNGRIISGFRIWQLDLLDFTSCNYNYTLYNFITHKPKTLIF